MPLLLLLADIQQSEPRRLLAGQAAMERLAENGELDQVFGITFNVGTEIQHADKLAYCREKGGNGGPCDACHGTKLQFRHRHQRARIASRHNGIGFSSSDTGDGHPHGRCLAAPDRLRSGIVRRHGINCVNNACPTEMAGFGDQRADSRLIAIEDNFKVRIHTTGDVGTSHDAGRCVVTSHRVKRKPNHVIIGTHKLAPSGQGLISWGSDLFFR